MMIFELTSPTHILISREIADRLLVIAALYGNADAPATLREPLRHLGQKVSLRYQNQDSSENQDSS